MKKALPAVGVAVAVLVIVLTFVGWRVVRTPQFALAMIARDVKTSGVEGLRPHLTQNAQNTLDTVTSITNNKLTASLMELFVKADYTEVLKSKLQQVQWELEGITRYDDRAEVTLRFNYDDRLIGTVTFSMVYGEDGWKIDALELPKFEEVHWDSE